jgi:hypothetical protein
MHSERQYSTGHGGGLLPRSAWSGVGIELTSPADRVENTGWQNLSMG